MISLVKIERRAKAVGWLDNVLFCVSWISSLGRRLVSTQPAVRQLRHHLDSRPCLLCVPVYAKYSSGSILPASRGTVCAKGSILLIIYLE